MAWCVDRRQVLAGAAVLTAVNGTRVSASISASSVTLIDPRLSAKELGLVRSASAGRARVIGQDVVRDWQGGLSNAVRRAGGAVAFVRWDKAILLAGLAREAGLSSSHRPVAPSLFAVSIR